MLSHIISTARRTTEPGLVQGECSSKAIYGQAPNLLPEMICSQQLLPAVHQAVDHQLVLACWHLLVLDNLLICAQLQVTQLPLLHGMDTNTGLLKRPLT